MAAFAQSVETFASQSSAYGGCSHDDKLMPWQFSNDKLVLTLNPIETSAPAQQPPQPPPPQVARSRAWLQVVAGFFIFMNTWGIINAFGVFQTYYSTVLLEGTSESTIAWIGTSTSFLLCASPVFWGPVFDLGYARSLVIAGSISIVLGIMLTSLCHEYWQLVLAQGVCVGVGGGCAFVTGVSILPAYFQQQRALAMGLAASGSSLGGIIYPIVFHQLQPQIGFAWAVRVIGFIAFTTLLVPCIILRPLTKARGVRKLLDVRMLKDVEFQLFNVATFLGFVGQYIPFFFIQIYAIAHGLGIPFWMLILLNVGSIPGRVVPSLLADKHFRPLHVLSTCTLFAALLAFCWIAIKQSTAGLAIWALLYGYFSGAFVSLQGPAVASMTPDMSTIGTRFGVNMFCGALGILIGSPVGGAILQVSWPGAQAFCGATLLMSALMVYATHLYGCKMHSEAFSTTKDRLGLSKLQGYSMTGR